MKILIDTNVLVDYFAEREPFVKEAREIIAWCLTKKLNGYVAAHSITDCFYILRKIPLKELREMLIAVIDSMEIISIGKAKLLKAISNEDFTDIEDSLQAACAEEYDLDYIVTRNVKDFKGGSVPAITPADLLEKINT